MKIIFFGTPKFAAYNLMHLIKNNQEIVSVVSPPDSKTGRGKKIKFCAVKEVALENNLPEETNFPDWYGYKRINKI